MYQEKSIRDRLTPVNTVIIAINVVVAVILWVSGAMDSTQKMIAYGASYWPLIRYQHEYYRLLTSAFMHFSLRHLFSNMLILFFIGDILERALGKVKYAVFYLVCAVGSGAASYLVDAWLQRNVVSAGASGAVFGVAGGILFLILKNRGHLEDLTLFRIVMFLVLAFYSGMSSSGVDNVAHISGVVIGFVFAAVLSMLRLPDGSARMT